MGIDRMMTIAKDITVTNIDQNTKKLTQKNKEQLKLIVILANAFYINKYIFSCEV